MRSFLRSVNLASPPRRVEYESTLRMESKAVPGVTFAICRVSFGRRLELGRRIRDLSRKAEYLEAGESAEEKIDANLLGYEIERIWLEWGLREIEGLTIDGDAATPESLMSRGPESLTREILAALQAECGLSEEERKN
jgi:hypothetical protein